MTYSILLSSKHLQSFMEIIAAVCIFLAFFKPRFGRRSFAELESVVNRIAQRRSSRIAPRRSLALIAAAVLPLIARLALLPVLGIPRPVVHDEFSYLLLGDTFAHGRIANPTPPEWRHFETEYVLLEPAYASQYQPAQGLFLAAGQVTAHHPWWGVWLSMGLMFAAICWGLQQALPARWALLGACLVALQFGIYGFWMNSYFGGAVAAAASAIVFGSLLRMRNHPRSSGAVCGFGLAILFASRPFEAILWTIGAAVYMWRNLSPSIRRAILPCAAVLASGAGLLAAYNFRVTGNALTPPYELYREQYGTPQSYWWQSAVTVNHFDFPELRANYENQLAYWRRRYSPALLWDSSWHRLRDFWRFFIGPFLTPALLFAGYLWRNRRVRPWLFISALLIVDHATYHAWYPQQSAASTILIVLMIVECWRRMRVWHRRRGFGVALSRNLVAGFAISILAVSIGRANEQRLPHSWQKIWTPLFPSPRPRDLALSRLAAIPGKHLVFVSYSPKHAYTDEWVFNGADIRNQRVIFARIRGGEADLALIRALSDDDVWLARPDDNSLVRIDPEQRTSAARWCATIGAARD